MRSSSNLTLFNFNNKKRNKIFTSFSLLIEKHKLKRVIKRVNPEFSKQYVMEIIDTLSEISSKERMFKIRSILLKSLKGSKNSINFSGVKIIHSILSPSFKYFMDDILYLFEHIKKTDHYYETIYSLSGIIGYLSPYYFDKVKKPLAYMVKSTEPIYLKFTLSHLFDIVLVREDLNPHEMSKIFQLSYYFKEEDLIFSLIISRSLEKEKINSERFYEDMKLLVKEKPTILIY